MCNRERQCKRRRALPSLQGGQARIKSETVCSLSLRLTDHYVQLVERPKATARRATCVESPMIAAFQKLSRPRRRSALTQLRLVHHYGRNSANLPKLSDHALVYHDRLLLLHQLQPWKFSRQLDYLLLSLLMLHPNLRRNEGRDRLLRGRHHQGAVRPHPDDNYSHGAQTEMEFPFDAMLAAQDLSRVVQMEVEFLCLETLTVDGPSNGNVNSISG